MYPLNEEKKIMAANNSGKSPNFPPIARVLLILAGVSFLGYYLIPRPSDLANIPVKPYSQFLQEVEEGKVSRVQVRPQLILYRLKAPTPLLPGINLPIPENPIGSPGNLSNPFHGKPEITPSNPQTGGGEYVTIPINDPNLAQLLREKKVVFEAVIPQQQNGWLSTLLAWVVPPLILVAAMQFFLDRNDDLRRSTLFNKNQAKIYGEDSAAKVTFANVAGNEEAKTELAEIVEFLKDPQRFETIGARIPRGVLLVGPPGTGKTLLAKAVAGEAGVTFYSIAASEFVELFVGTGAARVRDLFKQAKAAAPCIIFIDELDAIGKSRSGGSGTSGSNDEREQTLNQLLTEMDGFSVGDAVVIVLAATNRPETLDAALLRPGRFDRQVLVDRPDLAGRLAILEIYAQKVQLGASVDLQALATQTPGFSGADLANLVNEAALLAARHKRMQVEQGDFKEAIERVIAGLEKKSRVLNATERAIVAYHEVGHALIGAAMPGGGKVQKISIIPRGLAALGYTLKMPTEDRFLMNEQEYREQITMLLGGRAAEEVVFGNVTSGAFDDLQRATDIANRMVTAYGMSKVLGPLAYEKHGGNNFLGNGLVQRRLVSEDTAKAIDEEVKGIVEAAYKQAIALLQNNRELLDLIAQQLLKTEVLEGEELHNFLAQVK
jgi:cell division protease FtsH